MGGDGSGRRPDVIKMMMNQERQGQEFIETNSPDNTVVIPNYSGVQKSALNQSGLTPGSVIFVGADGKLTQDNANFFWDNTNNRVGIGTASPTAQLHLGATSQNGLRIVSTSGFYPLEVWNTPETTVLFRVDPVTGAVYGAGAISTATGIRATAFGAYMGVLNDYRFIFNGNNIQVMGGTSTELARFTSTGLGVGTASPTNKFEVSGGSIAISGGTGGVFRMSTSGGIAAVVNTGDLVGKNMVFSGGILVGYS